ncbi:MAG: alpha/beta hydrolase [Deltaproteobacteria bacterium]|nr:MAG: alpha/beta hydrolase [Deltaproteobacteria bacterium]
MLRAALAVLALSACASARPPASAPPPAPAFHAASFTVKVTGTGRPVIFIPGLACDGGIWDGTLAHLGGKVQAHVVSLAGFAGSPPIGKPPIIVGHSLGAFLAYWIAETAPDLIGGAVPVDGAPFFPALFDPTATPEKVRPDVEQMAASFAVLPPDAFATRMSRFLGQMISKPEDQQRVGAVAGKSDPKTAGDAIAFVFTTDLRPDLGKIKAPVVLIVSDMKGQMPRDALVSTWNGLIAAIPRHELVVIDDSKHFVMLDQPEAFYAALDKSLSATKGIPK